MASFTDNVQALSTFTPYVEQQPIEAMREVGMAKQQQYNQGVQQIQSSIDKVAGLDIMKDGDKKYLQTKLDTLGTQLQTVAAGDFSNFQLANSTAGMATQIGNDKIVQASVSATAKVRKQMDIANTAEVAGKSSVQNQWALSNQIQGYLEDPTVGGSFNGKYVEYTDIDKKLRDVTDKLVVLDSSIDDIYMRNADGTHILDKSGKPIVDEVMLSVKTKGKPAEKILNNFYSALNENDIQQLHIDASYHLRNTSTETLIQKATANASAKKKILEKSLVNMCHEKDTNRKLTAAESAAITANINTVSASLTSGETEKYLKAQIDQIRTKAGGEEYKYQIYSQETLTALADNLSNQTYDKEYKSNPAAQMGMEKKRLQLQYDQMNREQANFNAKMAMDNQHFNLTYQQKEREAAASRVGKQGIAPITSPVRKSTEGKMPTMGDLNGDINGLRAELAELNSERGKLVTNPALKTAQQKQTYLDYLSRSYAEDPSTIKRITDNNVRNYLEKRRSLEIAKGQKESLGLAAVASTKHFDTAISTALGSEKGLPHANGGKGYTAKQLYEFGDAYKTFVSYSGGGAKDTRAHLDKEGFIKKYKGTEMEPLMVAMITDDKKLTTHQKSALNRVREIGMKFLPQINNITAQKRAAQSEFLAARMPEWQSMEGALSKDSKTDMDLVNRIITMKGRESMMGGVDGMKVSDFSPEGINTLRADKNVGYTIEKNYDGSAVLHVTNGSAEQSVPMTSTEFKSYFPTYARNNPVSGIKYAILGSANQTTNLKGGNDGSNAVNAYLSGYDIKNLANSGIGHLVRVDIEGDGHNNGGGDDNFQVRMYVNNNGTWKSKILNNEGYVKEGGIQAILDNIGPNTVGNVLKK
jgi:hypothetical protein